MSKPKAARLGLLGSRTARRTVRSRANVARALALLLPGATIFLWDLARRADRIAQFDRDHAVGYASTVALSTTVWGALVYVATWRRSLWRYVALAVFVVTYALSTGVQAAFFSKFNVYAGVDPQYHGDSLIWAVVASLPLSQPKVAAWLLAGFAVTSAVLLLPLRFGRARRFPRPARPLLIAAALGAMALTPASYAHHQSTSPDFIYFHSLSYIVQMRLEVLGADKYASLLVRPQKRFPESVPKLTAAQPVRRNVLMILQESQRADATCIEYEPDCRLATRASNKAAPQRMPLLQMRSNGSSTHISMMTLWSGLSPNASRSALHSAPVVWEYARAAGFDTAYWTSQNLMFGNARMAVQDIPVSRSVNATELDPKADMLSGASDALAVERAIRELPALREPWFAVVHLANIHRPRHFDAKKAPFQPTDRQERGEKDEAQRNFYKNVVYLSDLPVGRLIEQFRKTEQGQRTVLFYTSDHGESYFEHEQGGDHSGSVHDEEILVGAWVDAPKGTLTEPELESVRGAKNEMLWHVDVAPTLLDLLGLWDVPQIAPFRARMMGHPITRPERTTEPVPLSNVTWVWEHVAPNWGVMQGPLKVAARHHDPDYRCFDIIADPLELEDLGRDECGDLMRAAEDHFGMLPRDLGRLKNRPDWGSGL